MNRQRLLQLLEKTHLIYLGALPALATFAMLLQHGGGQAMFFLFLGGVAAVGVYLAYTGSYVHVSPRSVSLSLLMLVDGPLIAISSLRWGEGEMWAFAIEGYLIDGIAIWLGIFILAFVSNLPTNEQRIGSILIMIIAVGVNILLFWPYISLALWGNWWRLGWLLFGTIEATVVSYSLMSSEAVIRDNNWTMGYILIFLLLWLIALFAGNVIFELRLG